MKNSRVSDVRIVKCPKCTKLLPEPADVPFYICGGCNTTLQAKYYKKADERRNAVSGVSGSTKFNEDDLVNEPVHLKVEEPSKLVINAGEVPGDHGSVGEHEDGKASSSNERKEQVRQDEIVVEEELLSVNSSSEDTSSETNTTKSEEKALSKQEADELNQNDEVSSCRLEQDEVASSSREVLLSSENSMVPVQTAELEPKRGVSNIRSEPTRPDEPRVGVSQNITANHSREQPEFGAKHQSEVSSRDEHVFIDGSSSQFLRSKQFGGVSSEIVTSSNDSMLIQDREPRHSTTESKERNEASLQHGTGEISSSFGINSEKMDESALRIPDAAQRAGSDPSFKHEVSTPSGQDGKGESDQSVKLDTPSYGNNRVPASSSSKITSQTAVNAIPKEKMADLRQTVNLQVSSLYGDSPKSPTRNSFASDGSVSSCDGNDNKRLQHSSAASKTHSASTLQRQPDDLQTLSATDSFHSAAQSIPAMLDEFKISRGFSNGSDRRTRTRPSTGQVFSRPSLYRRSPNTSYESSTRASLAHEEIYDRPESRVPRRIFTGPIYPYHEPNERYQICCHGARTAYHLPPASESWSSHLPYHHRSQYIPREPFESYTDSDYYEDQRQRDEDIRGLRSRRKSQALQHFQPVVGAAPFITCYKCSELLQLPSDFLVFKGVRLHRVKCSACSTVLKYKLENGRHLAPYSSKKNGINEGAESSSTLQKCASTSTYDSEKISLQSSSTNNRRDKGKNVMVETGDGPRVTWKQPSRTSPPLHQLMGYSSVSAALDGRVPKDREKLEGEGR